jgi:hypothetical protein
VAEAVAQAVEASKGGTVSSSRLSRAAGFGALPPSAAGLKTFLERPVF